MFRSSTGPEDWSRKPYQRRGERLWPIVRDGVPVPIAAIEQELGGSGAGVMAHGRGPNARAGSVPTRSPSPSTLRSLDLSREAGEGWAVAAAIASPTICTMRSSVASGAISGGPGTACRRAGRRPRRSRHADG